MPSIRNTDGGRQGHLGCYENGVMGYEVSAGSVPWAGEEFTLYGPDSEACMVVQVRSHWKPHNVPPGSPTHTVSYQLTDGGRDSQRDPEYSANSKPGES